MNPPGSSCPPCPESACWQALFDETVPPEERASFEGHLESCPACQARLDRAGDGSDLLLPLLRQVGDPGALPADPALRNVVERLREAMPAVARPGPADLYFLRPSDRPGVLGMLGSYEVQEVIGQGGMGVVLKAFEPALNRCVAIKVLAAALAGSATARERFQREARAAAAVCHDHVVAVHGVSETDGLPYLVMQYVEGESLQDRIDRVGPLEVEEVVRIGCQTAAGLAAAHAQGLIHRDVKPANLLLENEAARIKITDFGLARMADDVGLTHNGVIVGTPEYMAPEQARGEVVDHRADLLSLGSVLYACCAGVPPFRGSTALAVLARVNEEEPAPLRSLNADVPAWLEAFVARLMAKDPAGRFQSAAEAAALLEGYRAHLHQPATVPAPALASLPHSLQGQGDTDMSFACSSCGTNLRVRAELAGKKLKCPRCSNPVVVPQPEPAAPEKKRSPAWIVWLAASLGLLAPVLVLLGVWLFWPTRLPPPPSFLDVPLGYRVVEGVEEAGFYHEEGDAMGPFRWTDGRGRLVIPLDKQELPRALFVQLNRPKNSWLKIRVNDRELANEPVNSLDMKVWERTFDLSGIDLGEQLVVEVESNLFVPRDLKPGKSDDARPLGVTVRMIKLLRQGEGEGNVPAGQSFVGVTLGHQFMQGVAEEGFYQDERNKEGRFRWTNGNGKLVIPLDRAAPRPQTLWVRLSRTRRRAFQILVNQQVLADQPADNDTTQIWERTLTLNGVDPSEKLVIEIVSSTTEPEADSRTLGVKVYGIKLLNEMNGQ